MKNIKLAPGESKRLGTSGAISFICRNCSASFVINSDLQDNIRIEAGDSLDVENLSEIVLLNPHNKNITVICQLVNRRVKLSPKIDIPEFPKSMAITEVLDTIECEIKKPVSISEVLNPVTVAEIQKPVAIAEIKKPVAVDEIKKPVAIAEIQKPVAIAEIQKPVAIAEIQKPVAIIEVQEPIEIKNHALNFNAFNHIAINAGEKKQIVTSNIKRVELVIYNISDEFSECFFGGSSVSASCGIPAFGSKKNISVNYIKCNSDMYIFNASKNRAVIAIAEIVEG